MMSNENVFDKIDYVKKYLQRMSKTFDDAEGCRKCNESCPDMFNNGYKNTVKKLDEMYELITELLKKNDAREKLEIEEEVIKVPDEKFLEFPMEDEEEFIEPDKLEIVGIEIDKYDDELVNDNKPEPFI